MKIEGNRPKPDALSTARVEATPGDRAGRGTRTSSTQGDRVQVSSDAKLATTAAAAAAAAPDIRQDKVDKARKALDAGTVGADAGRLADKMIDSMLGL